MRNLLTFVKNNIYVIAGALCLVIICALYFTQNKGGENISLNAQVIYDSEAAGSNSAEPADASAPAASSVPQAEVPIAEVSPVPPENIQNTQNIQVYITGEVAAPGVYAVPSGARVWQVLEQAGGFTEQAAEDYVNLSAYVTDAQHIVVPAADDPALAEISPGTTPFGVASSGEILPVEAAPSEIVPAEESLIDINTADAALLQTLPGIGEQIASYIITYREENGGFKTAEDILNVPRIGSVTFEKIKDKISVGGVR